MSQFVKGYVAGSVLTWAMFYITACTPSTAQTLKSVIRPGMSIRCDGREVACEPLSPTDPYDRAVISGLQKCEEELAALKGTLAPGVSHAKEGE